MMFSTCVLACLFALLVAVVATTGNQVSDDAMREMKRVADIYARTMTWTPSELITTAGYPAELWYIRTPQQYEIGVHRIPNPGHQPVLFVHGFVMNAGCFVANFPENDLAFMLYDAGFDVWLVNIRGTKYSYASFIYDPSEPEFWDFSFLEPGIDDVNAAIDFILSKTGYSKLPLVSHSEGGSTVYAMLSDQLQIQEKISFHLALAPSVYITYSTCPILELCDQIDLAYWFDRLNISHTPTPGPMLDLVIYELCTALPYLCDAVISILAGWDMSNINASRVDIYAQCVDATSTKNVLHLLQVRHSAQFAYFDYGDENMLHYNQTTPPLFPIEKVTVPTKLYYGGHDIMVSHQDVEELLIPSLNQDSFVEPPTFMPTWSHADFIWSMSGDEYRVMTNLVLKYGL